MSADPCFAVLADRAVTEVAGPDWRGFLQGLLSQDVETLATGEVRFAALLTPQGRLLFDLFVVGREDGCLLDCPAERREALIARLSMYRLRAKVRIAAVETPVLALWDAQTAPPGWLADPRLPALGWRGYGVPEPEARRTDPGDYARRQRRLGVPSPADFGSDAHYPLEADFDLLNGVDFAKGCFVGQETTSRMKRRGTLKTRMASIAFDGPPPPPGTELLAAGLRAGVTLSAGDGLAMAALRLDRAAAEPRARPDGRAWRPIWPDWLPR